jgi:hypothetical protein
MTLSRKNGGCPPGEARQVVWNGHSCPLPLTLLLLLTLLLRLTSLSPTKPLTTMAARSHL